MSLSMTLRPGFLINSVKGVLMFTVACIDHIVLQTNQLEKMLYFYCNILKCKVERVQKDFHLTQLRAGNSIIDLIEVDYPIAKDHRNLAHFCLRITPFDFKELEQYFKKHNVPIINYNKRYNAQGYHWSFYLLDPENNEVKLTKLQNN